MTWYESSISQVDCQAGLCSLAERQGRLENIVLANSNVIAMHPLMIFTIFNLLISYILSKVESSNAHSLIEDK